MANARELETDASESTQSSTSAVASVTEESAQPSAKAQSLRSSGTPAPVKRKPSEASRLRAAAVRARKLDAIANRRAAAAKMTKAEFISEIVKGRFKPITAEEIAAEPTPPVEAAPVATPVAAAVATEPVKESVADAPAT